MFVHYTLRTWLTSFRPISDITPTHQTDMESCRVCLKQFNWAQYSSDALCEHCHDLVDTMCGMQDPEWWWFFDTESDTAEQQQSGPVAPVMAMQQQQQHQMITRSRGPRINELLRRIGSHPLYRKLGPRVQQQLCEINALLPVRRMRQQNEYVRQVWQWMAAQDQQSVDDKIQAICVY